MDETTALTAFIDVGDGNTFTGLLDQFTQDIQNSNIKEGLNENHESIDTNKCGTDQKVKEETEIQNEDNNETEEELSSAQKQRYPCPECHRYTAESEEKLMQHVRRVHRGENAFLCYMCDYSTYNKTLFEEHVRIHQGIKPYKCSFCPHKCVSKNNLKKHELIHRPDNPLKCSKCNYLAKHKRALVCHIKKVHAAADSDTVSCVQCNENFTDHTTLSVHLTTELKCDTCQFTTCSKLLLVTHKENEHNTRERKKSKKKEIFKCAMCEWSSSHKPRILLHLIHHPNQSVDETVIDISILKEHGIMT